MGRVWLRTGGIKKEIKNESEIQGQGSTLISDPDALGLKWELK